MSCSISSVIVDDEAHARQALVSALKAFPQVEIIAECEQGIDAIKVINEQHPQVLFLDIHMPKLDGFDVLELLGDELPLVVFVTAYDEYAIRAFDNNAVDYLLKPIDPARLAKTIERLEKHLVSEEGHSLEKVISVHQEKNAPLQRILIREGPDVYVIPIDEVLYFESADDYVAVQLENKTYIKQERMQNLEKLLDEQSFCRIHRSYLLNLSYLSGIETETKDSKVAVLKNGRRLPISRSGYGRLRSLL